MTRKKGLLGLLEEGTKSPWAEGRLPGRGRAHSDSRRMNGISKADKSIEVGLVRWPSG